MLFERKMEYKSDRYNLGILCEFRDKGTESDFMEYEKTASLTIVRFLVLLMGFVFAMFTLSDYYFSGEEDYFLVSVALRCTAFFISISVFFLAGKFRNFSRTLLMITLAEFLVFIIYLLNLHRQNSHDPSLQFMSMMIFILTVFLIPNRWKNSMLAGSTVLIVYIFYCLMFQDSSESPSLVQRGIYLFICLVSCAIFIYGRESSERKHFAAEKLLEFMSITDRLTGIYNRGRFEYILGLWIKNMRHDPFSLLLFDIDDFKKVNDTHGHSAGDQVLIGLSETVTASIRDDDVFARWGGEEFVILFGETPVERAKALAERILKTVGNKSFGNIGKVTVSIGVAQYNRGETITDFVNRADTKMYEAKQAGKNRVMAEIPAD